MKKIANNTIQLYTILNYVDSHYLKWQLEYNYHFITLLLLGEDL